MSSVGRPPRVSARVAVALREDLRRSPASSGYSAEFWSGRLLAMHLRARYGIAVSSRHGRRMLARLGVPRASDGERLLRAPSPAVAVPASDVTAQSVRGVISDQERKQLALRRMRRLCSSGLPLVPLVSGIFDLVQNAVPNAEHRVFLADPGNSPSRYLMNDPELAKWTPIHKRYYIDAPPAVSGMRVRFAEPDLSTFFRKTAWLSEEFTLPHFRRSEGYNEFLRPLGFDHMLWVTFADHDERVGSYPIWRSVNMPPFSRDDIRFMTLAAPHIAHGLKVANLIRGGEAPPLDQFIANERQHTGVVILDEHGKVLGVDKEAEAIFAEMSIADGLSPSALGRGESRELFAYLARMVDGIFRGATSGPPYEAPTVRLFSHRTGITLKMRGIKTHGDDGPRYVTVLVERGELRAHRRLRLAARLGLSGTDASVLDAFRAALTNAEAAARMQVAENTFKTYVRRLADKLGREGGVAQVRTFAHQSWV